jgi:adenosylcobinamide kinase/adenosylcobinamide-phosphate guanylyltransferase
MRTLILGGARSGKSSYAEKLAAASGKRVVYVATAEAGDAEMSARIARHRRERNPDWTTVEETLALGDLILRHDEPGTLVLVDCLTLWLSNLFFCERRDYSEIGEIDLPAAFHEQRRRLLEVIAQTRGELVLVSNELGMGIVPQGAVSRCFVDEAGRLNQAVAACCDRAIFVAAGLPLVLKPAS